VSEKIVLVEKSLETDLCGSTIQDGFDSHQVCKLVYYLLGRYMEYHITTNDILYGLTLANINGWLCAVYREKQHTKEDITAAKRCIKYDHDIVKFEVRPIQEAVDDHNEKRRMRNEFKL